MATSTDPIIIEQTINSPVPDCWRKYTEPNHIVKWNFATEEWQCPWAKNDLIEGGKFVSRMESRDGKMGFDFRGTYTRIKQFSIIEYELEDTRKVKIQFEALGNNSKLKIEFEPENSNPKEMQRLGWLSILQNFKKYTESKV